MNKSSTGNNFKFESYNYEYGKRDGNKLQFVCLLFLGVFCLPSEISAAGLSVLDETASDGDESPSVLILAGEINFPSGGHGDFKRDINITDRRATIHQEESGEPQGQLPGRPILQPVGVPRLLVGASSLSTRTG